MASSTPSSSNSSSFGSPQFGIFGLDQQPENVVTECRVCMKCFTLPKVLTCLHTFCQPCLEGLKDNSENIQCPVCQQVCALPPQGISGLLSDYAINNILELSAGESTPASCTACKTNDNQAVACCFNCSDYLCQVCANAHKKMHCFEEHKVFNIREEANEGFKTDKLICCPLHKTETLRYFCRTCNVPICKECTNVDHPKGLHYYDHLSEVGPRQVEMFRDLFQQSVSKLNELRNASRSVGNISSYLQVQYEKAQVDINDTYSFYCSVLQERKKELIKELGDLFNTKMVSLSLVSNEVQKNIAQNQEMSEFVNRILKHTSNSETLMFKNLIDSKLQSVINYNPNVNLQGMELQFLSNYQAIQVGVTNTFGYIRHSPGGVLTSKPQPIARPNGLVTSDQTYQNGHVYEPNVISKRFGSASSLGSFSTSLSDTIPYEKWSSGPINIFQNGSSDSTNIFQSGLGDLNVFQNGPSDSNIFQNGPSDSNIFQNGPSDPNIFQNGPSVSNTGRVIDLTPKFGSANLYPLKSEIRRQKMIYHCKFGEFGLMEGQFTEPSGIAVNAQNDIIVADTNNHRIQIFDKEGRFKFHFGECGKRDGQLLYPNRVAVFKTSGDIIVTERSPTHQIQIYNQYGQFSRKFGANILQHPRGVTVDNRGRIIVVECKVMRVIIFDLAGNVLQKFGCSKNLEFPNGVVVNDKQEIFISDNRAHCVKVFHYNGTYLRSIGGEGLTNYPIGVCMSPSGEVLVADNHNNFNITIFTQRGQLLCASESKVKHAQCFDVALMDEGSIVLASKDYRLYIYRYLQIPGAAI